MGLMGLAACLACCVFVLQIREGLSGLDPSFGSAELTIAGENGGHGLIVKRIGDNLTLSCALAEGSNSTQNEFVWVLPMLDANRSRVIWVENNALKLFVESLQPADAGRYICKSVSGLVTNAFVAVRPPNPSGVPFCGRDMFACSDKIRCIPTTFLCDGQPDCSSPANDEAAETCGPLDPCLGKLMCGDGRCIPKSWCCSGRGACVPHPCCEDYMQPEFPFVKTGGGLRKNPNEPYLLHATLYKACACLFVVITTATILISAICRARLKRISNSRARIDIPSPEQLDALNVPFGTPTSTQECQYSLVCDHDDESSLEILSQANRYPPSYSEVAAECNRINQEDVSRSTVMLQNSNQENPNTAETRIDGQDAISSENGVTSQNSPARRPNDFGMGFIANAIFNSWYRPCRSNEVITSMDYATDSDSSCRSPAIHPPNTSLNPGTLEFNSHFYGERIGGTPEVNALRGWSESRRLGHSNALDRILDRFGLNAPYNVDIDRDFGRNTWECQSFLSPPDYNEQSPRRNGQFFSSIWSRLKNRFNRNGQADRSTRTRDQTDHLVGQFGDVVTRRSRRRRPDTPDVPESSFNENNSSRLASFLNDNSQYEVYGRGYAQIHYFRQRGCYVGRDMQVVPPHSFPPPYSQFALDPPPPYVSRENLLVSRSNINSAVIPASDTNGNNLENPSVLESTIIDAVVNEILTSNVLLNETVGSPISTDSIMIESVIALNRCDDNGNLEPSVSNSSIQNVEGRINSNIIPSNGSSEIFPDALVNESDHLQKSLMANFNKHIKCTKHEDQSNVDSNSSNIEHSIIDEQKPSTSAINVNKSSTIVLQTTTLCNNNNNLDVSIPNNCMELCANEYDINMLNLDSCNKNSGCENISSVNLENLNGNSGTINVTDQNYCLSVLGGVPPIEPSFSTDRRTTEECGLAFPPQNLEYIDSDSNIEYV